MGAGWRNRLLYARPSTENWHDEGVAAYGQALLRTHTGTIEATAVHDGSILAHAADDDASHDATPALHVGEVKTYKKIGDRQLL